MVKRKVFVSFLSLVFLSNIAFAGEIDILLQKLVDKGVLTPGEAQQIGTETKEQVKKEIAQGKYSSLPGWVQNTKLKGDFRLRYQYDHAKVLPPTTHTMDTHRARIRARLGLESKVNEKLKVGIGLATGLNTGVSTTNKDTSRSPNQTLGDGFGKKPISLDYAYAEYTPLPYATFIGGRFKNPLWEPGDLIWDTDINPEGGAIKLSKKIGPNTDLFTNAGVLIIDEGSVQRDPTMFVVQPGIIQTLTDTLSLKGAVSYYGTNKLIGKTLDGTTGSNTLSGGGLLYEYRNIVPAMELSIKEPLKMVGIDIPYFALFGEYVNNVAIAKNSSGYMLGFKIGAEKVEKWADWQARYNYAKLEKDSILDILPDSDRYGGKTGTKAHEFMFDWGLGKNTWLGLDYYYGEQLKGNFGSTQSKPAQVLQLDWNLKF
ncbi:MAG: putative porin [Candidatus Omnitrophica bacterium]|nr:putative porin [Candidatus Omnitrophota bacterium]